MANLKIKLKYQSLEFEIEGEESVVREELDKFKGFLAGEFVKREPEMITTIKAAGSPAQALLDGNGEVTDFPILLEVVKKDLPKTEAEWVLIYAFYSSKFGQEFFTEKDIRDSYTSTGRSSTNRLKNLSNSIKTLLNKNYIKLHNETQFLFLDTGRGVAESILINGNERSKKVKSSKTNGAKKQAEKALTPKSKKIDYTDFDYSTEQVKSLKEYFNSKKPKTQTEDVLVVMRWCEADNSKNDLSPQEIAYMLDICSKIPSALAQVLVNAKGSRYRWIRNVGDGPNVQLTTIGRLHVDEKLEVDSGHE